MIIDTLQNAEKYFPLHPLFEKAFGYIRSVDLTGISPETYPVGDGLKAIVSEKPGKTPEESVAKFECHNAHIDIQLCIKGNEKIGWRPRSSCNHPKGSYNEEKDVLFFEDAPDMYFDLKDGQFALFFPEDVHAPMIGVETIKKMVIKVRLKP